MEDSFLKISKGEGSEYKERIFKMPKIKADLMKQFMESRNNTLLLGKSTMDVNGKCTVHEPGTGRDLISGDGALPQISRFANMATFTPGRLTINVLQKALASLSQKAEQPIGNSLIIVGWVA